MPALLFSYRNLNKFLFKKEITFIVGPRQSGKTTLMLLLKDYLLKSSERILFLNLDMEQDREFFISQSKLLKKIELDLGKKECAQRNYQDTNILFL